MTYNCNVELCEKEVLFSKISKEMNDNNINRKIFSYRIHKELVLGVARIKIILLTVMLLGFQFSPAQTEEVDDEGNVTIVSRNGRTVYRSSSNGFFNDYKLEYRGKITISDDDKDIVDISDGGYFELSKITFGNRRSIEIRKSGGRLIKKYYEGRSEVDYEPEGREWLADVLPEIIRNTGIAAESRTARIYKKS